MFGMKVTILYNIYGLTVAVIGGALILKKAMQRQLLAIFFGIPLAGIVIMGYLFNPPPLQPVLHDAGKVKKLSGSKEITSENILQAMEEVSGK